MGDKDIHYRPCDQCNRNDRSLGGNRLVGFRNGIAPISAWLWLQYWKPRSLALVAGGPGRSAHLQCDRARRIILRSNEHKLGFWADSFQCSRLTTRHTVPRSLSTAETRQPRSLRDSLEVRLNAGRSTWNRF